MATRPIVAAPATLTPLMAPKMAEAPTLAIARLQRTRLSHVWNKV